ncbi:ATP-binding cassette domain-containing protein [Streptosporangium sp. NBC_01755]|uniref:ABC transporter permease subunit n=1 Tax=unclassified Streptosporangium TaxID=2632669 RepID=UPI002DDA2B2F|nr:MULTISPECIES: ATP-binding cassette domain-containing protein [unclassified Streptosporangium]WSA24151.1 ATP-binding cassette domain-containing protein [Streptosporangium sp. NBC_01810]WSC97775.1 ATP-binding cassette domain-containing protein [Streptosporangium sp. NBC_01755]
MSISSVLVNRRYLVPGEPSRRTGLALLCVVLVAYFGFAYDNFFTVSNGLAILMNISAIAIAAVGAMFLVVSGNVDLSIGGQYALISVIIAYFAQDQGSVWVAVLAGLVAGLILGLTNGILVKYMKISPLIVTLGTMAVFKGLAYLVSEGKSVFGFSDAFIFLGRARIDNVPLPVIIATVVFVAGGFWLLRAATGLRLFAIGGNQQAARLTGIDVDWVIVRLYVLNGLLMGVVALLTTARLGSGTPQIGTAFELDVLTAVILGGVGFAGGSGHPAGVFVGVATIGILSSGLIFAGLADWWQQISKGLVLLLALGADQIAEHRRARSARDDAPPEAGEPVAAGVSPPTDSDDEYGLGVQRTREPGDVVLTATGLSRRFGPVFALRDGTFSVRGGEVVCVVGDNGAGKSTLIKLISGVYKPDAGRIELDGRPVEFGGPIDARRAGIETVHQDLAVCPNLGVAHNLILGDEPRRRMFGLIPVRDDAAAVARTRTRLASLGITLTDMNRSVGRLSGGQRQSVAIARAMKEDVKLVILDEPTAALGVAQTRNVLRITRQAAENGAGVILISHDIRTVFAVADRVVVLRLGRVVYDDSVHRITHTRLLHLMAGLEDVDDSTSRMGK